jgi:hypothetical protein
LGFAAVLAAAISGNGLLAQREVQKPSVQLKTIYQFTAADGSGGYDSDLIGESVFLVR